MLFLNIAICVSPAGKLKNKFMQTLKSPFVEQLKNTLQKSKNEVIVSSPFINKQGADIFLSAIAGKPDIDVKIITNLSVKNIVADITQPDALLTICKNIKKISIVSLARLHAKVYIVDESEVIVTSANLTSGGLIGNFEYGILTSDISAIRTIKQDILDYAALGSTFDIEILKKINLQKQKIGMIKTEAIQNMGYSELKRTLKTVKQNIETELVINKIKEKKTINSIFSETIMYLLSRYGRLTTKEIHRFSQQIHPELCNDNDDRVINVKHFGKRWKHLVRKAQQSLKERGLIVKEGETGNQLWFINDTQ
jgi:HKD family nuclease